MLILPVALAIWIVGASGLARTLQSDAPDRAMAIWPWNASAAAKKAETLIARADTKTTGAIQDLARRTLTLDASQPLGYTGLAFAADMSGDVHRARTLLNVSERMSRRNLLTQLWLLESAVQAGNIAGALRHFDVALRVSQDAQGLLFPVLTSAISDKNIQEPLAVLLRKQPLWRDAFLRHAAATANPMDVVALFARNVGLPIPTDARQRLVERLIEAGRTPEAYAIAGGQGTESRIDLATDSGRLAPFDWSVMATDLTDASRDPGSGALHASTRATSGQTAAARVLALAPDRYRLVTRGSVRSDSGQGTSSWSMTCIGGATIAHVALPTDGAAAAMFTVPARCEFQQFNLALIAATNDNDVAVDVTTLRIVPLSPAKELP